MASFIGATKAAVGNGVTTLTLSKPTGTAEGDLLVFSVVTRNKTIHSSGGPEGSGWTLVTGVGFLSETAETFDDPFSASYNDQVGIWYKIAGASEPSTYDLSLVDDGNDYARGTLLAFRGPTALTDSSKAAHTLTAPSVSKVDGGAIVGVYATAFDSDNYTGPPTDFTLGIYSGLGDGAYGDTRLYTAYMLPTSSGTTGDATVQADAGMVSWLFAGLVSFSAPITLSGIESSSSSSTDTGTISVQITIIGTEASSSSSADTGTIVVGTFLTGIEASSTTVCDTGFLVVLISVSGTEASSATTADVGTIAVGATLVGLEASSNSTTDTGTLSVLITLEGLDASSVTFADVALQGFSLGLVTDTNLFRVTHSKQVIRNTMAIRSLTVSVVRDMELLTPTRRIVNC